MIEDSGTALAPPGKIWRCGACGKRSRTKYGFADDGTAHGSDTTPDGQRVADPGWDESCLLSASLVDADEAVKPGLPGALFLAWAITLAALFCALPGCHGCDFESVPGLVVEFEPPCAGEDISATIRDGEYVAQLNQTSIDCRLSGAIDRPGFYVLTTSRGDVIDVSVPAWECHPETVVIKTKTERIGK